MKTIAAIEPSLRRAAAAKTRVAAYCRVSTGTDDQLVSLETQKSHYEEFINNNPDWEYAGIYYDEGITGTNKEKRPALLRMIADCENGKIDRVITKSISRFARNTADCLELTRKLLDLGVPIFFEKENIDTGSMESELLLSIMSSLAENESVTISENMKWGVRHRFENGTYKIAYAPYGYDVIAGQLFINEEEAKWVRWIFTEALKGNTSNTIANRLNELRVPSKKSGHWTSTTIRGMLMNEKYVGACLFQKTYSDYRFKRHNNHGEQDQFFIEGHHPAIISQEDFDAVGQLTEQRMQEKGIKKRDPRYLRRYPFTGKLVCGECGETFKRHINATGDTRYAVWVCKEHLGNVSHCSMKAIRESDLERAFTTMMNKLVFTTKEIIIPLLSAVHEITQKRNLQRIERLEQQLEKNAGRRQTLMEIMAKGYIEPALFTQENNDLLTEADALTAEKEQLTNEVTGSYQKADALSELTEYAKHALPSVSFDGDLVRRFLENATVVSRTEIIFHMKCGLNLTERI